MEEEKWKCERCKGRKFLVHTFDNIGMREICPECLGTGKSYTDPWNCRLNLRKANLNGHHLKELGNLFENSDSMAEIRKLLDEAEKTQSFEATKETLLEALNYGSLMGYKKTVRVLFWWIFRPQVFLKLKECFILLDMNFHVSYKHSINSIQNGKNKKRTLGMGKAKGNKRE